MPRGATTRHVISVRRSYSSEDEPEPKNPEVSGQNPDQKPLEPVTLQLRTRIGPRLWWTVGISVLGSVAAMTAIGCFCALIYPILKGMRVFVRASARATGAVIFTQVQFRDTYLHSRILSFHWTTFI